MLTGRFSAKDNVSHKVIVAALDCVAFRHFGDERQGVLRLQFQSFPYLVAVEDWDVGVTPVVDRNGSSHGKHVFTPFNSYYSAWEDEICKSIRSSRASERNDTADTYSWVAFTSSLFPISPTPQFPQPCDRLIAKTLVVFFHNRHRMEYPLR